LQGGIRCRRAIYFARNGLIRNIEGVLMPKKGFKGEIKQHSSKYSSIETLNETLTSTSKYSINESIATRLR